MDLLNDFLVYLEDFPKLKLRLKSIYFRQNLRFFNKLVAYAKGKSYLENDIYLSEKRNQIVVDTSYTVLNVGTERANFYQYQNTILDFPYNPQASGVGKVIKVGSGIKGIVKGDYVLGPFNHSQLNFLDDGNFVKLLKGIDIPSSAFLYQAFISLQGFRQAEMYLKAGDNVVVYGQGIVGRLCTLILRACGYNAIPVTATKDKLDFFKEKDGFLMNEDSLKLRLGDLKIKVHIDCTGVPEIVNSICNLASSNSFVILLGSSRGKSLGFDFQQVLQKNISLIGAHVRNAKELNALKNRSFHSEITFLQELILAGKLDLQSLNSKEISYQEFADFYNNNLKSTKFTGVLVDWTDCRPIESAVDLKKLENPTPKGKYGIALIGCGDIGLVNAKAVQASNSMELVKVIDKNPLLAKKLGEMFNVEYSTTVEDIKNNSRIDIVVIALPHFLHTEFAIKISVFKKHVIMEKPLATSLKDASLIINTAITNDILLKTYFPFVYEQEIVIARNLFKQDSVGDIYGFSLVFQKDRPKSYWFDSKDGFKELSWRGRKDLSGGGFLLMYLIHGLNNLFHITDIKIESVMAKVATLHHPIEVEDSAGVVFVAKNGAIGTATTSSAVRGQGESEINIWGSAGQIKIFDDRVEFYSNKKIGDYSQGRWHKIFLDKDQLNSRSVFLDSFACSLDSNEKSSFLDGGYSTLAVVEAAYTSSIEGKEIKVLNQNINHNNY
jgi:predicted dehydrogenase/NADPH:quinone reductase-like Zn-dependent oxidoreductase